MRELITDALITSAPETGPRHRTPLSITEQGERALTESLKESPRPDTPRDELVLRVALLHERVDPSLLRHLDDELQRCVRVADMERSYLGTPDRYMLQVTATAANWLARRWVINLHEARAAWCREALTLLRELAHPELNPLREAPLTEPEPTERPRTGRIDLLTLLEMAENGEPIPPWNG